MESFNAFTVNEQLSRQVDTILHLKSLVARQAELIQKLQKEVKFLRLENQVLKSENYTKSQKCDFVRRKFIADESEIIGKSQKSAVYRGQSSDGSMCVVKRFHSLSNEEASGNG